MPHRRCLQSRGAFRWTAEIVKREEDAELRDGAHPGTKEDACRVANVFAAALTQAVGFLRALIEHEDLSARKDMVVSEEDR